MIRRPAPALLLALCLGLVGCAGAEERPDDPGPTRAEPAGRGMTPEAIAFAVHRRVNAIRTDFGLKPLAWNDALVPIARNHSADMAHRDYFAHQSPEGNGPLQRYAAGGYRCRVPITSHRFATGGENLALSNLYIGFRIHGDGRREPYGARSARAVAERIVEGWMNSPGHRDNLLRPYWRTEAIGVVIDARGRVYATQNFC